jgi:hypothetical protein
MRVKFICVIFNVTMVLFIVYVRGILYLNYTISY